MGTGGRSQGWDQERGREMRSGACPQRCALQALEDLLGAEPCRGWVLSSYSVGGIAGGGG